METEKKLSESIEDGIPEITKLDFEEVEVGMGVGSEDDGVEYGVEYGSSGDVTVGVGVDAERVKDQILLQLLQIPAASLAATFQ